MAACSQQPKAPPDPEATVIQWRTLYAITLGFDATTSRELAESNTDLHQIERLLNAGCPLELAQRITFEP